MFLTKQVPWGILIEEHHIFDGHLDHQMNEKYCRIFSYIMDKLVQTKS